MIATCEMWNVDRAVSQPIRHFGDDIRGRRRHQKQVSPFRQVDMPLFPVGNLLKIRGDDFGQGEERPLSESPLWIWS